MTDFALWTRGLRAPELSVLRGQSGLNEYERRMVLSGPTPIKDEHADLSLTELAKLYPPPAPKPDEPERAPVPVGPKSPAPLGVIAEASAT